MGQGFYATKPPTCFGIHSTKVTGESISRRWVELSVLQNKQFFNAVIPTSFFSTHELIYDVGFVIYHSSALHNSFIDLAACSARDLLLHVV